MIVERPPNRFEKILQSHSAQTEGLSSYLADISLQLRLSSQSRDAREQTIVEVFAGVACPLLVTYVAWVLRQADAMGVEHLYFCARDGQILLEIANLLAQQETFRATRSYLFISRQACRLAGVGNADPANLNELLSQSIKRHDRLGFLETLGLSNEDVEALGLGTFVDTTLRLKRVGAFLSNDKFVALIEKTMLKNRPRALGYFNQEGLNKRRSYGLVDSGWAGSTQKLLSSMLRDTKAPLPVGFYLGFHGKFREAEHGSAFAFLLSDKREVPDYDALVTIVETFCAADHATTVGYDETNGIHHARLAPESQDDAEQSLLNFVRKIVRDYCAMCGPVSARLGNPDALKKLIFGLVSEFVDYPTRQEAMVFGDFTFSGQATRGAVCPIGPSFTTWLRRFLQRPPGIPVLWGAAALKRSSPAGALLFRATFILRTLLRNFRQR